MINYDRENITIKGLAKVKSRHRAGVQTIRLGTRLECVRSLPRVSGACQDGPREFTGRRPRLVRRLSGVAEKLVGMSDGCTATAEVFGRLNRSGLMGKSPIPGFQAAAPSVPVGESPIPRFSGYV
ncbi:hypothetical protein GW17_00058867 [Ensete ventricosum]|nr:hypothetical protein GW17_00058867 [Ensete ventricosum]